MTTRSRLDEAVARGIITPAQREAILALGGNADSPAIPRGAGEGAVRAEAPRGFNAVTVAYAVGAAAVLFAFAWFLFERWSALGALGVLLVSLGYATLFFLASRVFARNGFQTASAIAILLVVGMTPVVTWALLALAGLWYEPPTLPTIPPRTHAVANSARWLPIEIATMVVASVALWRVRFGVLALPIAVAAFFASLHLVPVLFDPAIATRIDGWMALFLGSLLLLAGYAAEQRQAPEEDYAQWIYLVGLIALMFGLAESWSVYGRATPPIVALLSIGAVVASLYLRRRVFLLFGGVGAVSYLAYLAFDVFRRRLGFSIVLAAFGLTLIALTVWLQQRYPALARRVAAEQGTRRPAVPGGYVVFAVGAALTFVLLVTSPPRARRVQAEIDARTRVDTTQRK